MRLVGAGEARLKGAGRGGEGEGEGEGVGEVRDMVVWRLEL
jgi:hypothetical protein